MLHIFSYLSRLQSIPFPDCAICLYFTDILLWLWLLLMVVVRCCVVVDAVVQLLMLAVLLLDVVLLVVVEYCLLFCDAVVGCC